MIKLYIYTFNNEFIDEIGQVIDHTFNQSFEIVSEVSECDYILAAGGDGTILGARKKAIYFDKPIIGYNKGTLGFLACGDDVETILKHVFAEKFSISKRDLLTIEESSIMPEMPTSYALNDIVISNNERGKLVNLNVMVNANEGFRYCADSLIISTPTGSTAYNLSAGGSIVHPSLNAILMTPVAPFSMSSRPVIIPPTFRLNITSPDELFIKVDGRGNFHVEANKELSILYNKHIGIVQLMDDTFFKSIEQKLQWNHIIKQ